MDGNLWLALVTLLDTHGGSRNLGLALAAGNATIWKPAPGTPLCSVVVTKIVSRVLEKNGIPGAVASLVTGGKDVGEALAQSKDIPLGQIVVLNQTAHFHSSAIFTVSFTGSEAVGRGVGRIVQSRFGKPLLELGGNNGSFLCPLYG